LILVPRLSNSIILYFESMGFISLAFLSR
jgi:hypothetical protein